MSPKKRFVVKRRPFFLEIAVAACFSAEYRGLKRSLSVRNTFFLEIARYRGGLGSDFTAGQTLGKISHAFGQFFAHLGKLRQFFWTDSHLSKSVWSISHLPKSYKEHRSLYSLKYAASTCKIYFVLQAC